jgi:putative membrane protein
MLKLTSMKKKLPTPIKDGLTGMAIGTAIIVPGVSGGTIALVFGAFKRIVNAVDDLFTKRFWKSLLILLPFLLGAIIAVAALVFPFQLAFKYCLFSIVCLFAGFILGSIPGITDELKEQAPTKANIIQLIIGFILAGIIGVFSVIFKFNDGINTLFANRPWYLYLIIFVVGIFGSSGLIVPGFSGSMLLLVIGFYQPILNLVDFSNFWPNVSLGFVFALGVLVGFIILSKVMNRMITHHRIATLYVVVGFIFGSLISLFVNSQMFAYIGEGLKLLDCILGPVLLIVGITLSTLFVLYTRKHKGEENAEN